MTTTSDVHSGGSATEHPHGIHSYAHGLRRFNCKPYFKVRAAAPRDAGAGGPWNVADLCAAYNWPTGLAGGGVIAIVELGGGWVQSDIDTFFGAANLPSPSITDVSVDGTQNTPTPDPKGADGEVALDIQVAAAAYSVATGQPATVRMYWTQDIAAGVRAATADGCDVCSISWGSDEANWGPQALDDMEAAATAATAAGMVVFAASGDNDSADGGPTAANVDAPASCPHVVGCGGTKKTPTGETVWNHNPGDATGSGSGGGYSVHFTPLPTWQAGANSGPGRLVPDVSGNADPDTGYNVVIQGTTTPVGGTSAVAPLYAGLFAAFGKKLGWVTPKLYLNQTCFNDIISGDNGAFRAGVGPDPCSGIGSPIGTKLAQLFNAPPAVPPTATTGS